LSGGALTAGLTATVHPGLLRDVFRKYQILEKVSKIDPIAAASFFIPLKINNNKKDIAESGKGNSDKHHDSLLRKRKRSMILAS
jgi:hypothetical protein